MTKTVYTSVGLVSEEQLKILKFINLWVHEKKTPVPYKEIVKEMDKQKVSVRTVEYSVKILVKDGFIRRAQGGGNSKTAFVQLRTLDQYE